jgi:hypothetical protein
MLTQIGFFFISMIYFIRSFALGGHTLTLEEILRLDACQRISKTQALNINEELS